MLVRGGADTLYGENGCAKPDDPRRRVRQQGRGRPLAATLRVIMRGMSTGAEFS
ncbi:hypothetical protein [Haladaptatus sp. T7]|uniref:hypothetical protein n=1 Tax=Haladaptatus sp. T7 TaxID=2029368 RepID=UPI002231AE15|nr:hypothetical protein [Haladaptatus sp. T7]